MDPLGSGGRANAFRYGGEEFAILLPGADAAAARIVAERLREAVETLEIALDQVMIRVTVSGGVAACPRDGSTVQQLVGTADAALYRAKGSGRNRVCEVAPA